MIVDYATVLSFCVQEHSEDIEQIHLGVEDFIKERTGHDFEEITYTEYLSGTGSARISLKHYPVSAITRISPLTAAIKIKNSALDSTNAFVSVDSDSLDLKVEGGTSVMTASLAFTTYTTLTTLIAQIITEAKGWTAEIYDADYASIVSSNLVPVKNLFCGAWGGVAPSWSYLEMMGKPLSGYEEDDEIGEVYYSSGFSKGYHNYIATYTAYADVPENIKTAVMEAVQFMVQQKEESALGVSSYTSSHSSVKYEDILPKRVLAMIDLHTKVM